MKTDFHRILSVMKSLTNLTSSGCLKLLSNIISMSNTPKLSAQPTVVYGIPSINSLVFTKEYVDKQDRNYLPRTKLRLICRGFFLVV